MPSITNNELLSMETLQKSDVYVCQRKAMRKLNGRGEFEMAAPDAVVEASFKLLPGENVEVYSQMNNKTLILLTNYRLFVDLSGKQGFYNVLIRSIDSVECREIFYLHVYCKDGRCAKIAFDNNELCLAWFRLLNNTALPPSKIDDLFAFAFHAFCGDDSSVSLNELGFKRTNIFANCVLASSVNPSTSQKRLKDFSYEDFDTEPIMKREFDRLGFDSKYWRITGVNNMYKICSTYPKYWIVPASMADQDIEKASRYRTLKRVPAVVWRDRTNGAVLVRCSQPESGIFGWRSQADETLLHEIYLSVVNELQAAALAATNNGNNNGTINGDPIVNTAKTMLILDARSYAAAWANRAKGGGFESGENYQKCDIQFLGLANIHSIRYSFQKLRSLLWDSPADVNYFQYMDQSQWVYHCWALLAASSRVVDALHAEGRPVLVHCSDGWDRTTQIVSLAKLLLDPYYRTMIGFKELIEREWISFGHKFAERSGLLNGDPNQRAPVFLQWLDCVHYLMHEYPCAFEFNKIYLTKLAQHAYSGLFGTFLCNSVSEYVSMNVGAKTLSIWSYLHPENCQFRNLLYVAAQRNVVLTPRLQQRDLAEIWRPLYCPPDDPANVRPRAFSTTSTDDKIDRSLNRAHSCDNLAVCGGSAPGSIDNLHNLHRTGSDSSLTTAPGKNTVVSSLHSLNMSDKEAVEESLKALLNNVDFACPSGNVESKPLNNRRHSTSGNLPSIHFSSSVPVGSSSVVSNGDVNVLDNPASPPDEPALLSSSLPQNSKFIESNCEPSPFVRNFEVNSFSNYDHDSDGSAPNDVGTSTSDLTESTIVRLPPMNNGLDKTKNYVMFNVVNGSTCRKLNPNMVSVIRDKSTIPFVDGSHPSTSTAVRYSSCCAAELTKSVSKKDNRKLQPIDLIDGDGLKRIVDPTQQRIREIMNNYEKRLELQNLEIQRLKMKQEQNGNYINGVDLNGLMKNGRHEEINGDTFEPTSYESRSSENSWESVDEQDVRPVLWVPDHASSRCMNCDAEFWTIKRKHHCRSCGKIFCKECSSYECPVPEEQFFEPVRVCYKCYESLCVTTKEIVSL